MRPSIRGWVVLVVLLGTMAYAIAEDVTFVSYVPSPRGIYSELRSRDGIKIGSSYFTNPTGLNGGLIVEGNVGIGKNTPACRLDVTDTTCVQNLNISGLLTTDRLRVNQDASINLLSVDTNATITGSTTTGGLHVINDAAVDRSVGIGMAPSGQPGRLDVLTMIQNQGQLINVGEADLKAFVYMAGPVLMNPGGNSSGGSTAYLTVIGNSYFEGTMGIGTAPTDYSLSTLGSIDVGSDVYVARDFSVNRIALLHGTLSVDGTVTLNKSGNVLNDWTVGGNMKANGDACSSSGCLNDALARITALENRCNTGSCP